VNIRYNASYLTLLIAVMLSGCDAREDQARRRVGQDAFIDVSQGETAVCGVVNISLIDPEQGSGPDDDLPVFSTIFSRGPDYSGMEDNDIRGYLDGSFKEGWNQVSQAHLRLGRRGKNPAFGEFELFRNLQRWADLPIPRNADILGAKIVLTLESGPPFPIDIAVYAVSKDWNPGNGGTRGDNNSPPKPGEAWWLEAKAGETPWSQAGAGHASDDHPQADTRAQPLAIAHFTPRQDRQLTFSSSALTTYLDEQVKAGEPVRLLYKLLDVNEDSPGSVLEIWSANFGVAGSDRRPSLHIEWQPTSATMNRRFPITLEPGRMIKLPGISVGGKRTLVSSYNPQPNQVDASGQQKCGQQPYIEYRLAQSAGNWTPLYGPMQIDANEIELRVAATGTPVDLGTSFVAEIRDTWITAGKAEEQDVQWHFTSPNGETISTSASYVGDYTWQVSVNANSIGRWRYNWSHALSGNEMRSEDSYFDVIAWDPQHVIAGLQVLRESIETSGVAPRSHEMLRFELSFMRLQRAATALQPDYSVDQSSVVRVEMRKIRQRLSGKPLPDTFEPKSIRSREGSEISK